MPTPIKFDEFELAYIREQLAIRTPLHTIVERVRRIYDRPTLMGQHIQAIKERDKEIIKEIAKRELNNTSAVAMSFARTRLEFAQEMMFNACQPLAKNYKETEVYIDKQTGEEKVREVTKVEWVVNHAAVKGWMDFIQQMSMWHERLTIEKISKGLDTAPTTGIPIITAYTGYEDEEDLVLIEAKTGLEDEKD